MPSSLSIEHALNPYPWYQAARETNPVAFEENFQMWSVFSYNEVQRVLSEHATFSSQFGSGREDQPLDTSLISIDPPRHRQMRSLVSQAFTPRRIAQLETRIRQIVEEIVDRVAPTGQMDVINDLAYPLPVIVIAEMLGIPHEDREKFKLWSDQIIGSAPSRGVNPQKVMGEYFQQMIKLRRQEPRNDLISALLEAQIDGKNLSETELLGFCVLLLVAGNETTTTLLGNAFWCFDEAPESLEELSAHPELIPSAVEEVLRYRAPIRLMFRVATTDTQLAGREIKAGQALHAWIASANRDEAQFPNADRFDIRRTPNRHLGFGYGIHFCLGAPLARLEARIALEVMLARLPQIRRNRAIPLAPLESMILYGVKQMPITFQPGK